VVLMMTYVIKLLREKIISNIFSFRGHITWKHRSKFVLKNLFLFNSKLKGRKLGFNAPLTALLVQASVICLHKKSN